MIGNRRIGLMSGIMRVLFLLTILVFSISQDSISQVAAKKASRQAAIDAFTAGRNDEALQIFTELLSLYPKDPLYNYYSGVCLVNLGKTPQKSLSHLTQAIREGGAVRNIPDDALFWLARAQQQSGKFNEAIRSFESFASQAGKKRARELGVQEYITQCEEGRGRIEEIAQEPLVVVNELPKPTEIKTIDKVKLPEISMPPDTLPSDLDKILDSALNGDISIDSAVKRLTVNNDIKPIQPVAEEEQVKQTEIIANTLPEELSVKTIPAEVFEAIKPERQQLSKPFLFQVKDSPEEIANQVIEINPEIPSGLIYRIQMAVFRNPPAPSYFKGITPVYGIRDAGTGLTNYYAGMFRLHADASKALLQVRNKGFRDAFINSLSDGKPVSAERAAILEKEWGHVPFTTTTPASEQPADTLPPALLFRVEILKSIKPVPADQLENIKKLTSARGLDVETDEQGKIVYLTGSFISFESAEEYADLLSRNGLRDARVVARLGKKEIPVETAKQLFEIINN